MKIKVLVLVLVLVTTMTTDDDGDGGRLAKNTSPTVDPHSRKARSRKGDALHYLPLLVDDTPTKQGPKEDADL
ncbi:hypothetical protein BO82DRAFT_405805 [Aspergillus uvarum CBS 121591]|uniref:Uncharacterized protein n=1 Tax=Aspergillus uvarum CBS 121591 TaxID=1448315 RepID=A0A319BYH2_9EURO|nr:hypothetical protein BO82DRAFT_405805 [Aspergillus uvarum CBS 121591]PYH77775.1 hypothetical protein BO82DRAFT_405805 [Aspergillus uvarum CBS 121591]